MFKVVDATNLIILVDLVPLFALLKGGVCLERSFLPFLLKSSIVYINMVLFKSISQNKGRQKKIRKKMENTSGTIWDSYRNRNEGRKYKPGNRAKGQSDNWNINGKKTKTLLQLLVKATETHTAITQKPIR